MIFRRPVINKKSQGGSPINKSQRSAPIKNLRSNNTNNLPPRRIIFVVVVAIIAIYILSIFLFNEPFNSSQSIDLGDLVSSSTGTGDGEYQGGSSSSSSSSSSSKTISNLRVGIHEKNFPSVAHSNHSLSEGCINDGTDKVLEHWLETRRVVCDIKESNDNDDGHNNNNNNNSNNNSNNNIYVEQFVLKGWEYQPTTFRYRNIEAKSWGGQILPTGCPSSTRIQREKNGKIRFERPSWAKDRLHNNNKNVPNITIIEETVMQVDIFDTNNPYEAFHAYINAIMIMKMHRVQNPRLVLLVNGLISQNDLEMWTSFSEYKPVVINKKEVVGLVEPLPSSSQKTDTGLDILRYRDLIDVSSSGTSMIVTKTNSQTFKGRGLDHHCKSKLFRDMIHWMTLNHNVALKEKRIEGDEPIQIVWSSRQPYCCRNNDILTPRRIIENEEGLIRGLEDELLDFNYMFNIVEFGNKTAHESIELAAHADIMIGVHGAGLVWSGFMPPHSGLVEIFGGDRGSNNRHYHNIASLADLHYRQLSMSSKSADLVWTEADVKKIAEAIRSIHPKERNVEPS